MGVETIAFAELVEISVERPVMPPVILKPGKPVIWKQPVSR